MNLLLEQINPDFRFLVDKLFFTDVEVDCSNLVALFDNKEYHYNYLWDRFSRSSNICWNESFWKDRFSKILSCNIRRFNQHIETQLLNNSKSNIINRVKFNPQINNTDCQFLAWIKAKSESKDNVMEIKEHFVDLINCVDAPYLISTIDNFIPTLFIDSSEYLSAVSKKVSQSEKSFDFLLRLEKQGFSIDKNPLYKTAQNLLFKRAINRKNKRSFFALINDADILKNLQDNYNSAHQKRLIEFVKKCDYNELESRNFVNITNLLALDSSIADEILTSYADRLYSRGYGHKRANIQRIINVCKLSPLFSRKKILAYLVSKNKMRDIKFLVAAFPEIKNLVVFA